VTPDQEAALEAERDALRAELEEQTRIAANLYDRDVRETLRMNDMGEEIQRLTAENQQLRREREALVHKLQQLNAKASGLVK